MLGALRCVRARLARLDPLRRSLYPALRCAWGLHFAAFTTRGHVVRAMLEAICFQSREVLEAMILDTAGMQHTASCPDLDPAALGELTGRHLVTEELQDLRGRPDENQPGCLASGWLPSPN